jgi:hypothetical protein
MGEAFEALNQSVMHAQCRKLVVIQPGADQLFVFQRESKRPDQMQLATGVGAQADDVAGIGRDLRLVKDHMEHKGAGRDQFCGMAGRALPVAEAATAARRSERTRDTAIFTKNEFIEVSINKRGRSLSVS